MNKNKEINKLMMMMMMMMIIIIIIIISRDQRKKRLGDWDEKGLHGQYLRQTKEVRSDQ